MMLDLDLALSEAQLWLWQGFVVFLRVGAIIALAPAFGEEAVPPRIKLVVALGFTLIVLPGVAGQIGPPPASFIARLGYCGAEVMAGLLFGLLIRIFVMVLQIAGTIAAQAASISQLFGGSAGAEPQPAIGHLLVTAGLALAVMAGLHVQLAAYLLHGYVLVPPGTLPDAGTALEVGLEGIARGFGLAFSLAAPFVAAALLYNLILGIINRAMPQLMVTFVGAPALTLGGLLLLMLAAPPMLALWSDALSRFLAAPFAGP